MSQPAALPAVSIVGVGHHLPSRTQDNASLCLTLDVSPEWIVEKTGIEQRYRAEPSDTAWAYALAASRAALDMAGVAAADLDLIIACTFSGDYIFPPLSVKLQHELSCKRAQTFDLQANCAGFVAGLTVASDRMRVDPTVRFALVVGVELCSRYIDDCDANTAIYLSDGAGAAVLAHAAPGEGILGSAFHTDGSNYEAVRLRGGGASFRPVTPAAAVSGDSDATARYMEMNGIATWKQAITHMPSTIRRACEKAQLPLSAVDFFVFHQANLRLIEYLVRKLGFDMSKTYANVAKVGNCGAASLAIALSEAVRRGCIARGDILVLAGVGAGFNFAASVWRFTLGTTA